MNKWLIISFLLLLACTSGMNVQQHAKRYSTSSHPIHSAVKVYHTSSDSSEIHFQLLSSDLLYTRSDQNSPFVAKYKIHYRILDPVSGIVLDSNTRHFTDVRTVDESSILQGHFPLYFQNNRRAKLQITIVDLNRNASEILTQKLDKQTDFHTQNFILSEASERTILSNIIKSNQPFKIKSRRYDNAFIYMKYYPVLNHLPPPPFSRKKNITRIPLPDTVLVQAFGGSMNISLDKFGVYHFTNDTTSGHGFTLLRFSDAFPEVATNKMLYEPLRYLTSSSQYNGIVNAEDTKVAVDKFWIQLGGSKDAARKLIKAFYGRVENANMYFSTFVEGWRTDRGLIYIIFGPPEQVIELNNREIWQYGNEAVSPSLSFTFTHVDNELSSNVFELERSVNYEPIWYRAVDTWRSGRIYTAR